MRCLLAACALVPALVLVGAHSSAHAAEEPGIAEMFSSTITLTSDYRFRGHSQTDRRAAVQGGIDFAHPSGIFAGVWASTINFNDPQNSPLELDFTAGYSHEFSESTAGSIAGAVYTYPSSAPAHYEYFEIVGTLSHDFGAFALNGEFTYSPDYSGQTGTGIGASGGIEIPIAIGGIDWLSASAHAGRQWIEDNLNYGTPDWIFYDFGLTATWNIFAFDVRYTGTDLDENECFGGTHVCGNAVVWSVTLNLPFP